ncbi:hypothetical protein [Asticcacaulis benevestitus]|uniref:Uncharacterized protein n=1 Tax=Asticcacaulis benevestitus DSM 16100 = ATCC BAA-896 TaxID=1121022 RepID=V4P990_9CAUL|nr:hypothetical protein [Asticcacaulis benevestitus]ESQ90492.1 hypothetical protein ABENE_12280 [Asticcacaulis benevestitus DSM 16100 = ATCC BAA-896]
MYGRIRVGSGRSSAAGDGNRKGTGRVKPARIVGEDNRAVCANLAAADFVSFVKDRKGVDFE